MFKDTSTKAQGMSPAEEHNPSFKMVSMDYDNCMSDIQNSTSSIANGKIYALSGATKTAQFSCSIKGEMGMNFKMNINFNDPQRPIVVTYPISQYHSWMLYQIT